MQTNRAAMSSRRRLPNRPLPMPPCSQTHIGDVFFICCAVLGRETLGEKEEKVRVGTPSKLLLTSARLWAEHLPPPIFSTPGLPIPWHSAENSWDLKAQL